MRARPARVGAPAPPRGAAPAQPRGAPQAAQAAHGRLPRRRPQAAGASALGAAGASIAGAAGGGSSSASGPAPVGEGGELEGLEDKWQSYLQGEEFHTFHAVVDCLLTLPSTGRLAEHRAEFELLIHLLHRLGQFLGIEHVSKGYRAHYSPDVQLNGYLYSTLLTAYTLLPSYVLNGQEFYVSETVLDQCRSLQSIFRETCQELRRQFESLQPCSLVQIRNDVRRSLAYFDRSWVRFEMPALEEIEAIHRQACRPLIEAIEAERTLLECEGKALSAPAGGREKPAAAAGTQRLRLDVARGRLMEKVCVLNRLANIEGKGRGDMCAACVAEAERIVARSGRPRGQPRRGARRGDARTHEGLAPGAVSGAASPVLQRVAESLLRSLGRLRRVLQRYGRCLYQLNSHLANNTDLVRSLEMFEGSWETASRYLVQPGPRRLALAAFDVVSGIRDPTFDAALASLDPGFLVASLPRSLLFHELRAAAQSAADAAGARGGPGGPGGPAADPKALKALDLAAGDVASATGCALPRPGLDSGRCPPAAAVPAIQRSPLAKAFLPAEAAASYNEVAAALARMPEHRLNRIRCVLASPPGGGSCASTPARSASGAAPRPAAGAATPLRGGTGGTLRGGTAGTLRGRSAAGQPPRTPCPPRMAVPNSSRPPTSVKDVVVTIEEPDEDEDSDEEDALQLDLAGLSAPEVGEERQTFAAEAGTEATDGGARALEEGEARKVVASISTLALHLQRAKPHEWNELIQVVLQGVMLARGTTAARGRGAGGCAAGPVRQEAADASAARAGQPHSAAAAGLRVAVAGAC